MNDRYGCTANAAGKIDILSSAVRALVVGLALLLPGAAALATSNPIPGIDIIVKKNPSGIAVTLPSDASGKFSLRLKEPGNYTISTACRQPGGCLPHKLSGALKPGASGEPSIIAILIGLIVPAQKASADGTTFNFTVGDRGIVLSGQFQDLAGVRVAVGDINGDGRAEMRAAPLKTDETGKPQFKVADNESPLPKDRTFLDGNASLGIITVVGVGAGKGELSGVWNNGDGTDLTNRQLLGKTGHAPKPVSSGTGPHRSLKAGEPTPDDVLPRAVTIGQPFVPGGGTPGIAIKEAGTKDPEQQGVKISENASPRPTTRGSAPGPTGGDGKSDQAAAGGLTSYSTAPRPDGPVDNKPLGRLELLIKIAHEGGGTGAPAHGRWVSTTTADANGAFKFDKLPPGQYKLTVANQLPRSVTVDADGTLRGSVMRGSDGSVSIFDAQGNPMTHATAPRQSGEDGKLPGLAGGVPTPIVTFDRPGNPITGITISLPANPDAKVGLPGIQGDPVPGTSVGLDHDPGGAISTNKTDVNGVFHFDKLPAGKYKLKVDGLPDQSLTVGADGIAGGTVMRGRDGRMSIFDRWGTSVASSPGDTNNDGKPAARVTVITVNPVNVAPSKAADPIPTAFGQPVTFTAMVAPVNPANNPPAIAEANSAMGEVSTRPDGGDGKLPSNRVDAAAGQRIAEAGGRAGGIAGVDDAAPNGDETSLPGIAGDPVPGTSVGLDHDPGGPISTTKTGPDGAYQFTGLPAGKYKLTFPGLPAKSIMIGTNGKTGGKVLRDGNNLIVTGDFEGSPARSKATANPVPGFLGGGFPGIGNVMGGILPGMSPGVGGPGPISPVSPAAGPMGPGGPAGPMGPGAGAIRR